jgi:hypothetical protein
MVREMSSQLRQSTDVRRYLFYHDTSISGKNHLRSTKVRELLYDNDGKFKLAEPQK